MSKLSKNGFSLVEIVLALGIVSFAIVAILGMFPIAMQTSKESVQDTHAAFIAQALIGQLKSQSPRSTSIPIADGTLSSSNVIPVNLAVDGQYYVYFDTEGAPVMGGSGSPSVTPQQGVYLANLRVQSGQPAANLSRVTVDVSYPQGQRRTNTYATVLRNTDS